MLFHQQNIKKVFAYIFMNKRVVQLQKKILMQTTSFFFNFNLIKVRTQTNPPSVENC